MNFDALKSADFKDPTVALFYGAACAPCDHLKPRLRRACEKLGLRLEEFNSASELSEIRALNIRTVPSVVLVHKGKATRVFDGLQSQLFIEAILEAKVKECK